MQLEDFAMACPAKHIRSSSADEHPTSLSPALAGVSNTVVINATEADQRVIVVAGLPVHHYRAEDEVAEAYAMVFLVESGFAQQRMWRGRLAGRCAPFGASKKRYAHGGMAA